MELEAHFLITYYCERECERKSESESKIESEVFH